MILFVSVVLAEPFSWTVRTPVGSLDPGNTEVRLVIETLDFKILNHNEVQVRANYILDNPGAKTVVHFAVPVTSGGVKGGRASSAAASVRMTDAAGEFVPCLVRPALKKHLLPLKMASGANEVSSYCTADLVVDTGVSFVRMSFEGELFYESFLVKPSIPSSNRTFLYDLRGAANWKGQAEQLEITLNLGPFASTIGRALPEGGNRKGSVLSWSFTNPDYEALGVLLVELGGEQMDVAFSVAAANDPKMKLDVQKVLVDADPATTWCGSSTRLKLEAPLGCAPELWIAPATEIEVLDCETGASVRGSVHSQVGGASILLTGKGPCFELRPTNGGCLSEVALRPNICPVLPEPTEP